MSRLLKQEKGITIIENLVAMSLFLIGLSGSYQLYAVTAHGTASTRSYSALVRDVHSIIDNYRSQSYASLLDKFGISYADISDGLTTTETLNSNTLNLSYQVNITAVKTQQGTVPQAVIVYVAASQNRGIFEATDYSFETVIAQVE